MKNEITKESLIEIFIENTDLIKDIAKEIITNAHEDSGMPLYEEIKGFINDIKKNGCSSGVAPNMTSMKNTYAFFDKHHVDILELINKGEITFETQSINDIKNDLSWMAYEIAVSRILSWIEFCFSLWEPVPINDEDHAILKAKFNKYKFECKEFFEAQNIFEESIMEIVKSIRTRTLKDYNTTNKERISDLESSEEYKLILKNEIDQYIEYLFDKEEYIIANTLDESGFERHEIEFLFSEIQYEEDPWIKKARNDYVEVLLRPAEELIKKT